MYQEFKQLNLSAIDKEILEFWEREKIFEKSYEQRDPQNSFVFYEGPPSANGMPGIHHVMARTIKDIFCRFQTLNGKRVERKGGWDTHGLPIELAVEKELGITKEDIGKRISVDEYNAKCKETVMRFKDRWDEVTIKNGYWVDLENPYVTYENEYIETVWFLLKRLYERDYLYKGYTIQPYSPAAGTGLSSHELNMPDTYKNVTDTTVVAMFKAKNTGGGAFLFDDSAEDVRIIAWTTTPWTLPSNTALTVGGNIDYVKIKTQNPYTHAPVSVVLAEKLVSKWFGGKNQPTIESQSTPFKGKELDGIRYEQLMDFGNEIQPLNGKNDAFRVILGDFVTTEDGTGIVHTAPSFGGEDMKVARQNGIGSLTLVDKQGKFVDSVGEFSNRYVKDYKDEVNYVDVNVDISVQLKIEGFAFNVQKYVHTYPHCWRTDKPVLYYPLDSWFIAASKAKERMFELNQTINWKPAATGEGRFGKWLENLQDWNLSRSRYWGIPLPIWRSKDEEILEEKIIGSMSELAAEIEKANKVLGLSQKMPKDLHRPYIDDVVLVSENGQAMYRELDLIDVWFDSGSMPYAQWGLNAEKLKNGDEMPFNSPFEVSYPADFIAEGVDQTRGWFYTLHAIATMAYDSVAFKNVVSNGLVLDKDGKKMSKRLGNAVDPFETLGKFGADATRWYMISAAQPWDNLKFNLDGITEVRNKFFGTLYNTYNFFAMYANVDGFVQDEMNQTPIENRTELDHWILSRLHSLVQSVSEAYDTYEPTQAARAIEKFVDEDFSNWYVRLNRRRFWKGEMSDDKKAAYETMFQCLMVVGQLSSPIAPFFSDWLYRNLTKGIRPKAVENNTPLRHESVHLTDLVKCDNSLINKELEQRMDYAQRISSLILSLRKRERLRVRQPLSRVMLPILDENFITQVEAVKTLILAETNVKKFEYITDTHGVVVKKIKPNFKTLGKTLGGNMRFAQAAIEQLSQDDILKIEKEKTFNLVLNDQLYVLSADDFLITSEDIPGWFVASDGDVTVALDVTLTPELEAEGTARDLVNKIQNIRKDQNFNITDKISVKIERHAAILAAVEQFSDYIKEEVLATDLALVETLSVEKIDLNDSVSLKIEVNLTENDLPLSEKTKEIASLFKQLELDNVERTESTNNTDKFGEAICAFSNDYPNHQKSGYLLIGVKNNGDLTGLKVTDKLLLDLAAIRNNGQILPQPAMTVTPYSFPDGDVAVVEVQPSFLPPVRYKGKIWIRTGPSKAVANETEERQLTEKRASSARTFDALPCFDSRLEDLNTLSFLQSYLPYAIDKETLQENNRPLKHKMASLRMFDLKNDRPTNVGVLTFGLDPRNYFNGCYIQYIRFGGTKMTDSVEAEKEFRGNLMAMLGEVDTFISNNIIQGRPMLVSALREKSVFNYPNRAIRELLMNAMMHRDYESNSPIRFYEFSDRIEIQNPGYLYGEANARNFPNINAYRNPIVAEMMKNLGYVNRFNVGIKMAKDELSKNGNPEPTFDLTLETNFLAIIYKNEEF